ncbi:MAG TPA: HAMP domain-containing sensor histidine kinase [Rectinemataceae bacterium]|nr:HAMP domain-containing sensor histidine kinase [Rectinemataceae bacterium]
MRRPEAGGKASIRRKLVLLVALITCMLTSLFALAYYFVARANTMAQVRSAAEQSLARLQEGLEQPLWNLDTDASEQLASGELNDPWITAVIIRDDASETLFGIAEKPEAGKPAAGKPDTRFRIDAATAPALLDAAPISMSGPIAHSGRRIGTVAVLADPEHALGTLLANVLVTTLLTFLLGAAIAATLFFAVDRIITLRLLALGGVLERFSTVDDGARSTEPDTDEIGRLGASFNGMADTISERTAELESRTEELRLLLARVEREREEERTRVARELHDELGQGVTSLGMALYLLERRIGKPADKVAEMIPDMRNLLSELSDGMRRLIADLRPSVLDRLGLAQALAQFAVEIEKRSGIEVECSCRIPEDLECPETIRIAAFRVAKEAVNNALRHSKCAKIGITLTIAGEELQLEVKDDGQGFDAAAGPRKDGGSFGIIGMRERCRALGGEFHVTSSPGRGATVSASFPLFERIEHARADR